jgi:hypothetical protein
MFSFVEVNHFQHVMARGMHHLSFVTEGSGTRSESNGLSDWILG